jgi:hypothetical protein
VASLPIAIKKSHIQVYNGNQIHRVCASLPHECLAALLLRYCLVHHCEVLVIKELANHFGNGGDVSVSDLPKRVLVNMQIADEYLQLYSMPDTFHLALTIEKDVGTTSFIDPYVAAKINGNVVVVHLNEARDGIDRAYCKCNKVNVLWCAHVIAVLRRVAQGRAINYNGLK